jgi:hypothetical protein
MARKRAGLRAMPRGWPAWLRVARNYLADMRRKDLAAYRAMRGRVFEAWPDLAPAFDRVEAGYRKAIETGAWRPYGSADDAGTLCALVFEAFARWALKDRKAIDATRDAERELLELQDKIARAADELCEAVKRAEELCLRYGLEVSGPRWVDDLGEAVKDLAHRFPRWGNAGEVRALIAREDRECSLDRPGITDAIRSALSVGVLRSASANPVRNFRTGEWLRTTSPEVIATNSQAGEVLRVRAGSGATKAAPQLRVLFVRLREMSEHYGEGLAVPGPLEWLTVKDISRLCNVFAGGGPETPGRRSPWGVPSEMFKPELVRSARANFV